MNHASIKNDTNDQSPILQSGRRRGLSVLAKPSSLEESVVRETLGGGPHFSELFRVDDNGFLLVHRKLREHWIAADHKTLPVFLQILMRVEWKSDQKSVYVSGQEVKLMRGQMTCGRKQLAFWSHTTEQNCRTALNKLKSTNTITIKSTSKFSIITLLNWDKYQFPNQQNNQQKHSKLTSVQPAPNQRLTTLEQDNNRTIEQRNNNMSSNPTQKQVTDFFTQNESSESTGNDFYDYYSSNGWKVGKNPMKQWEAAARRWIRANPKRNHYMMEAQKRTMTQQQTNAMIGLENLNRKLNPQGTNETTTINLQ